MPRMRLPAAINDEGLARSLVNNHRAAGPEQLALAIFHTALARDPGYFNTWPERALLAKQEIEAWVRSVYYGVSE